LVSFGLRYSSDLAYTTGQDARVLHHLHVDLAGVAVAGRGVVGDRHLGQVAVDDRVVQLLDVVVARRADRVAGGDEVEEAV
jgi:hypothetical protein